MHMVIRAIVEADNAEDALGNAISTFEGLCGGGNPFDYYTTFDEENPASGKSRWGNLPVAAKLNSKEGKKLVEEGIRLTKDSFLENMKYIRETLLCCTDEEIYEERIIDDKTKMLGAVSGEAEDLQRQLRHVKYRMSECGQYKGPSVWLYDQHGGTIRNAVDLGFVLKGIKPGKAWVVPADVHY